MIDADAISRASTSPGGAAIPAIKQAFGADYITRQGGLDRDRMRASSFSDPSIRARLEAIVHPLVGQESARMEADAIERGVPVLVFDIPLLVESGRWRRRVDSVIVIDCTPDIQVERVMARSGLTKATVLGIIASQATREARLRAADWVVFNGSDSLGVLERDVAAMAPCFGL